MCRVGIVIAIIVVAGCCDGIAVGNKSIRPKPVDRNDAKAIAVVDEIFQLPYQSMDFPKTDTSFAEKVDEEDVRKMVSGIRPLVGEGTIKYLFDIQETGFDREMLHQWYSIWGLESTRAGWILGVLFYGQQSDIYSSELSRRLQTANDSEYKCLLIRQASIFLPFDQAAGTISPYLTNTKICMPKVTKTSGNARLQYNPRNRICDQVLKEMFHLLRCGVSEVERVQWLQDDKYDLVMKSFTEWWDANKSRVNAEQLLVLKKRYDELRNPEERGISTTEHERRKKLYCEWLGLPDVVFMGRLSDEEFNKKTAALQEWEKKYADFPVDKISEPDLGLHMSAQQAPHE